MAKSPAFQFYPSDFLTGTAMFKPEERGAYITLLCLQWEHGGIEESDIEFLSGLPMEKLTRVLKKFSKGEDGLLKNERMEEVRAKQILFYQKQAENGRSGGRPKTQTKPKPNPDHNPDESQTITQTITQKKPYGGGDEDRDIDENIDRVRVWQKKLLTDTGFFESACMNNKISVEEAKDYAELFTTTKLATGDSNEWHNYSDYKRNFLFWIPTHIARLNYEKSGRTRGRKSDQIDPKTGEHYKIIA